MCAAKGQGSHWHWGKGSRQAGRVRGEVLFSFVFIFTLSDFFIGERYDSQSSRRLLRLLLLIHAAGPLEAMALLLLLRSHDDPTTLRHDGPQPVRQVRDVLVAALGPQRGQRRLQPKEVVRVRPAGPGAARYVLGQRLRVLGADELVVVRGTDVDEGADGRAARGGRRVEGRVVDRVAVDLADVEVLLDL
jgi:hypothetical protein